MKTTQFIAPFTILFLFLSCSQKKTTDQQSVNAVICDVSYIEAFDEIPDKNTDETLRIKTHLKYVEQLLREKDVSHLSHKQQKKREYLLDLLEQYRSVGQFPKNLKYSNTRVPCFIDKYGNICAVGYLIEQTAGREVAERINNQYQYEYVLAMNDPEIDQWIHSSGLTKKECAMIQPAYGPVQPTNHITPANAISSAAISGVNLSLCTINGIQLAKGHRTKFLPIAGLITGAGQVTLGALNYPDKQMTYNGTYVFPAQRNLSMLNIGLGTSTIVMSAWNLLVNKKPKNKSLSWNLYGYPTETGNMGLGFSLTKRL